MSENRISRWWAALLSLPVIGIIIKDTLGKVGEPVAKALGERLMKALGAGTEGAKRSATDEILFALALYSKEAGLTTDEIQALDKFEMELRNAPCKNSADSEGCLKAEAYVLYVANILGELKTTITEKSGTGSSKTESTRHDYSPGFAQAGKFFKEILKREKFEEKVDFLKGKNVFSLISKKKGLDVIGEALKKKIPELSQKGWEKTKEVAKEVDGKAKEKARVLEDRYRARDDAGNMLEDKKGNPVYRAYGTGETNWGFSILKWILFLAAAGYFVFSLIKN